MPSPCTLSQHRHLRAGAEATSARRGSRQLRLALVKLSLAQKHTHTHTGGPPLLKCILPGCSEPKKRPLLPSPLHQELPSLYRAQVIFLELTYAHSRARMRAHTHTRFLCLETMAGTDALMRWKDGGWRRLGKTLLPVPSLPPTEKGIAQRCATANVETGVLVQAWV